MKLTSQDLKWIRMYHDSDIDEGVIARTFGLTIQEVREVLASRTDSSEPPGGAAPQE